MINYIRLFQDYHMDMPGSLISQNSLYDPLTNALNIYSFRVISGIFLKNIRELEEKAREFQKRGVDIIYFNITSFQSYNEKYGFERGSQAICKLANILAEAFPNRMVARFAADQFIVMAFSDESVRGIEKVNGKFSTTLYDTVCSLKAGIYTIPYEELDCEMSIFCDRAKSAADSIKRDYWKIYRYFDQELAQAINRRHYIVEHLDEAIEKDWIKVYYQPVIRSLTREVCGVEALARWEDPVYGLITPDLLIGTLEEYQLIHKLDLAIVTIACRETGKLLEEGKEVVPFSFNVSRLDFELCDIYQDILEIADKYQIPKKLIHIEITESVFDKNPEYIKEQIKRFHQAGFEVWMDDFGSGYSSLNTLKDYDFDVIKIDMLFLRRFDNRSQKILTSIVDMAKRLGIRTLAEGVETEEQLAFLRDIGCEKLQGFLIGKPQPLRQLASHLHHVELSIEPDSMRNYYDDLGRVNLLSTRPLESDLMQDNDDTIEISQGIPLAIWEYRGDRGRFLLTNKPYRSLLRSVGVYSPRALEFDMNDKAHPLYGQVRAYFQKMLDSRKIVTLDQMVNGNYLILHGRAVSRYEGGSAYVLVAHNVSEHAEFSKGIQPREVMSVVFQIFDVVELIDPKQDTAEPVYIKNHFLSRGLVGTGFSKWVGSRLVNRIHPGDQKRFLAFMNPETMEERLSCRDHGMLTDYFRTMDEKDHFQWMEYDLFLLRRQQQCRVLFCSRPAGFEHIENLDENGYPSVMPTLVKDLHQLSFFINQEVVSQKVDAKQVQSRQIENHGI
ncbi:MAG: GGDEF domain-containing phosphodiesterase [Lachnospiraceae bacterium]|nr:GGDEF domain-containing phosphodiesterase [Lachnospiraceae bacterium]